jgi:hypothetical protein
MRCRVSSNRRVLLGRAGAGVNHKGDDIGVEDGFFRAGDTDHFHFPAASDATRLPHARRVDDAEAAAVPRQHGVNRVARRPRHVADEYALFT